MGQTSPSRAESLVKGVASDMGHSIISQASQDEQQGVELFAKEMGLGLRTSVSIQNRICA